MKQHPLATVTGLGQGIGFLLRDGAMCPKCGHGTRATSQRWARCTGCGARVQRKNNRVSGPQPAQETP
jgi:tRNA(Ile2) C34 agmatinyltransferase TiaS